MPRRLAPRRAVLLAHYVTKHPYPCPCPLHHNPHGPYEKSEEFKSYRDTGPMRVFEDGRANHFGCILWRGPGRQDAYFRWYDPAIRKTIPITIARYTYLLEHGAKSLAPREHVVAWCNNVRCCNPEHMILRAGSSLSGDARRARRNTFRASRGAR